MRLLLMESRKIQRKIYLLAIQASPLPFSIDLKLFLILARLRKILSHQQENQTQIRIAMNYQMFTQLNAKKSSRNGRVALSSNAPNPEEALILQS